MLIAMLLYVALITAYMIWHQEFFSPDRFVVFAFLGMLVAGRAWMFLWDWLPPILLILGYDYVRGLVPDYITKVHIHVMIYFDKFIFGAVPTLTLQHLFFVDGRIRWYDNVAVIFYFAHFVVPLFLALVFWVIDRKMFKLYMLAMVILSYAAFITYFLFPAMPPWLASQQGFLPPVAHIMDQVLAHFARPISLPTVYQYMGANLVAAVPSLHAAYPFMAALFVNRKFPRWGKLFFLYPAIMWVSVIYLGEHYFFDIVVAVIYTLVIYVGVINWRGYRSRFKNWILKLAGRSVPQEI